VRDPGGKAITPDQAETVYIAAIYSVEELRDQLRRLGFEDTSLEDAEALREDLLAEVEKLHGQPVPGPGPWAAAAAGAAC
jgi:hypothetical protein